MVSLKKYRRVRTPTIIQMEAVECGAAALAITLGYHGKFVPLEELRVECGVSRDGSNAFNLVQAANKYQLEAKGYRKSAESLLDVELPAILFWEYQHFVVLEGFSKNKVFLNDPATGPRAITYEELKESYTGIALCFKKEEGFQKGGKPLSLFKEMAARLKKTPKPLVFLFIGGLCLLIPGFALPAFLMVFINTYFSNFVLLWKGEFLGAVLLTALFSGLLNWMQLYFLNRFNSKLSMQFSRDFLLHLLKLPMNFYAQRHSGEIGYRMTLNTVVAQTLTGPVISALINLLLIGFYGIVMFAYDAVIASISVGFGIINLVTMYWIFKSRANAYAYLQQNIGKSVGQSIGGLQNIEAIKSKGLESDFFSKWAGYYTKNVNSSQEIEKKDVTLSTVPLFFQALALAALLGIGSLRIIEGSLSIGTLMALQLLQVNFLLPINRFMAVSAQMQNMKKDMERLDDVMSNATDSVYQIRQADKKEKKLHKLTGDLEFRDVSFQYSPRSPFVIQNLSFHIKPGQRVAFVGPAGCGKSTIAKMATGLYYPASGQILYDGIPLNEISVELFRNSVASVDQDIFLFSGTIRENLTFWNRHVPDEILIAAAQDAHIHREISGRDRGYDSLLVEGGRNLSGGQRQRLEIARALLYKPSLLVLDEATSSLDSKTEKIISDNIRQRGCSALMIAHRLSTIQDCDEIIVLEKGIPIQRGSHHVLRDLPGVYQQLVQSEVFEE